MDHQCRASRIVRCDGSPTCSPQLHQTAKAIGRIRRERDRRIRLGGANDATPANRDAMPGSLQRIRRRHLSIQYNPPVKQRSANPNVMTAETCRQDKRPGGNTRCSHFTSQRCARSKPTNDTGEPQPPLCGHRSQSPRHGAPLLAPPAGRHGFSPSAWSDVTTTTRPMQSMARTSQHQEPDQGLSCGMSTTRRTGQTPR